MSYQIKFLKIAELELEDAVDWYEAINKNIGADLILNLDELLNNILENPFLFPIIHKNLRKARLRTFPYSVIYEIHNSKIILVLGIIHHKRNPNRWINR